MEHRLPNIIGEIKYGVGKPFEIDLDTLKRKYGQYERNNKF